MSARYIPRHKRLSAPVVVHVHTKPEPPLRVLPKAAESPDPRRDLWARVAVAVAQASNSTRPGTMVEWADAALAAYDARFK